MEWEEGCPEHALLGEGELKVDGKVKALSASDCDWGLLGVVEVVRERGTSSPPTFFLVWASQATHPHLPKDTRPFFLLDPNGPDVYVDLTFIDQLEAAGTSDHTLLLFIITPQQQDRQLSSPTHPLQQPPSPLPYQRLCSQEGLH